MWEEPSMSLEPVAPRATNAHSPAATGEPATGDRALAEAHQAGKFKKKFVLLATPQTGSSQLVETLDQHPQVRCLDEVFNPKGTVLKDLGFKTKKVMAQAGQS